MPILRNSQLGMVGVLVSKTEIELMHSKVHLMDSIRARARLLAGRVIGPTMMAE